jgi:hypothetical protein
MDPTQKHIHQFEHGKRRGWIVYLLYVANPMPVDFSTLLQLMDARNFPMSCRRFSEKIDFLRSVDFIRVFEIGSDKALTGADQAKLIQRYCETDGDCGHIMGAKLTSKGINFQEGHFEETGVVRVN